MSIADGFTPTAPHTLIRIQPAHGIIPGSLIGVKFLTAKDIRLSLVPGYTWAKLIDRIGGGVFLPLGLFLVLMLGYVLSLSTLFIKSWARLAAAASALNSIHYLLSLIGRYLILYHYPLIKAKGQSDSQRYRQLGNAVAVPCAKWIGERLLELLDPVSL